MTATTATVQPSTEAVEFSTLRNLLSLLRRVHINPLLLCVPILVSLCAASMEGMSIGLLIPLLNGFLQKDFSFLKETPGVSVILSFLPASITTSDKALFGFLLGLFCSAIILKNVLRYISVVSMTYIIQRAIHHLRKLLFGRFMRFGKLYFDTSSIGQNVAVFSEFLSNAVRPLMIIDSFVNSMFSLIAYLIIMSLISWQLTLVAIPLFVILHFALRGLIGKIQQISHKIAKSAMALSRKTVDILSAIPLVKSYNAEEKEQRHYAGFSDNKARLDFRMTLVDQLSRPIQELTTLLAMLFLFTTMTWLLVRDHATAAPSFLVYFYIVYNAATKFSAATGFRTALASSSGALAEVLEVLSDKKKFYVPDGTREFRGLQNRIEFRNLSFSFPGSREVIDRLSFSVEKGKMTALVGPTGAGKTTIVNLLLRFYDCPPGTLFIDGTDIREFIAATLREHMALVSQETLLLHDALRSNICYGVDRVSDEQLREILDRARLTEYVAGLPFGLDTLVGDRGVKLSGGEKQRVSIARALLKNAEILLLDEATSSLDSRTEALIQEAINEVSRGKTSLVIAHRLSTIKHADKIVVIEEGRCVEQGTLDELLAKQGRFHEYWEQQKFS